MGKRQMHKTDKPKKKEMTISQYELYKKTRKDWGEIDPRTKVKDSQKKYNRKKEKQKWQKEIDGAV